jgi:hypothetical protein
MSVSLLSESRTYPLIVYRFWEEAPIERKSRKKKIICLPTETLTTLIDEGSGAKLYYANFAAQ